VSQFKDQDDAENNQVRPVDRSRGSSSISVTHSDYSSKSSANAKVPSSKETLWTYLISLRSNEDLEENIVEKVFKSKKLNRYIQVKT
jgi:hypothetical protein